MTPESLFQVVISFVFGYLGCCMLFIMFALWQMKVIYKKEGKDALAKWCSPPEGKLAKYGSYVSYFFFPVLWVGKSFDYLNRTGVFDEEKDSL